MPVQTGDAVAKSTQNERSQHALKSQQRDVVAKKLMHNASDNLRQFLAFPPDVVLVVL